MLAKTIGSRAPAAAAQAARSQIRCLAAWDLDDPKLSEDLLNELTMAQNDSAQSLVPWFLENMPRQYNEQVPEELRKVHLKAAGAFRDFAGSSDLSLKLEYKNKDGSITVTNFNTSNDKALLMKAMNSLEVPTNMRLAAVGIYQTNDHSLTLQMFTFKPNSSQLDRASVDDAQHIMNCAAEIRAGEHSGDSSYPRDSPLFSESSLLEYLKFCTPAYCAQGNPRRFLIQRRMYERVRSTDKVAVHVEPAEKSHGLPGTHWITIAAANVLPDVLYRITARMLHAHQFEVEQSHMDRVEDPANSTAELPGFVTMLRVNGAFKRDNTPEHMQETIAALKRAKWYDEETVDFGLMRHPEVGIDRAEVITALCSMLHGPLSKLHDHSFSSIKQIVQTVECDERFVAVATKIADLFLNKFNPENPLNSAEYSRRERELRTKVASAQPENAKTDPKRAISAKVVLNKMLDAVNCTLRSNFYSADRYALSFRVDPVIMATEGMGELPHRPLPFGVYFAHGRHFNAFHCRFRDVARGGLRVVTPPNADTYASESSKHFDEVYNLSYAQQLKNKDIPEGGAKAVIIVNTPIIHQDAKFFAMRKAIRAFTDSVFDLMVKDSVEGLVDYLKTDELLYFGPDEQVIASDVDWITQRAAQRGYPTPNAFMSSKPLAGFNHKEFGVTSEGVVVFLDVALRKKLNIDPKKDKFTIKITGGPDGDVAGNLMKILIREYPDTCKIVGVADGFGVAEDPNGLDHGEILRLFNAGEPINKFNTSKLTSDGCMFDATSEEGAARRNSMVFRVKADAFIPGGGRPGTIDKDNWHQFLDSTGKPTSSLIVEGANLFNTMEAREKLFEKGVAIVKDSSANKCGVMTSSYEVQSSLLLSTEEFMSNKAEIVEDVYVKLKQAAGREAELLFREYNNYPGSLVNFSERISAAINKVTDALRDQLQSVEPSDPLFKSLMPLIKESLPTKLAELGWERVPSKFPVEYQRCLIASQLASKLVYQEGIHLVEAQPATTIADRAIAYYFEDIRMKAFVSRLEKKDLGIGPEEKEEVLGLLKQGGARTALDIF